MKGIILAGGSGSRLFPMTLGVSKQLLPVYDKPMIYYPLSSLLLAGIRDILVISTPHDLPLFKRLLGSGEQFGVQFSFCEQPSPGGLAQAFILGKSFINQDSVCLILGDNIFYGHGLSDLLQKSAKTAEGATIFAYEVNDPERYGVVTFSDAGEALSIEEKPLKPKSNWVVPGIYFYDKQVTHIASTLKPSARGEIEITGVNEVYLQKKQLKVEKMGRGFAWLDTGTQESMLQASNFVQTIQERQGLQVCCPEEIAFAQGFISKAELMDQAEKMKNNAYGSYLKRLLDR